MILQLDCRMMLSPSYLGSDCASELLQSYCCICCTCQSVFHGSNFYMRNIVCRPAAPGWTEQHQEKTNKHNKFLLAAWLLPGSSQDLPAPNNTNHRQAGQARKYTGNYHWELRNKYFKIGHNFFPESLPSCLICLLVMIEVHIVQLIILLRSGDEALWIIVVFFHRLPSH